MSREPRKEAHPSRRIRASERFFHFAAASLLGVAGLVLSAATSASVLDKPVPPASASLKQRLSGFSIGAHRGGMSFPDQNTVRLFEAARREGADIVETDLRASRDGEVFLFHDKLMDRLTDCTGPISAKTAREIRRCRLRGTSLGLSTFREALAWSGGRVVINAEFKSADVIEPAIRLVREFNAYRWVYFQTDGHYQQARDDDPRVALLVAPSGPKAQQLLDHFLSLNDDHLAVIELHPEIRTPENIRAIHAAGKLASENSWHFGKERSWWHRRAECDAVFRLGIDIAITDVPEDCVAERDRLRLHVGDTDGDSGPQH